MPPLGGDGFQHGLQSSQLKLLSQREIQKIVTENVVTVYFTYKRKVSWQPGGWKCKDFYILNAPILKLVYQLFF